MTTPSSPLKTVNRKRALTIPPRVTPVASKTDLDEHYSAEIAKSLQRGRDVVGVTERPELRDRRDVEILTMAAAKDASL